MNHERKKFYIKIVKYYIQVLYIWTFELKVTMQQLNIIWNFNDTAT
jgi:hypothetical protein